MNKHFNKWFSLRFAYDFFLNALTYIFSSVSLLTIVAIFMYIFSQGSALLSFDLIRSDYHTQTYITELQTDAQLCDCEPHITLDDEVKYSSIWGIGFIDGIDLSGDRVVYTAYVHPNSPFSMMSNKDLTQSENTIINVRPNFIVIRIAYFTGRSSLAFRGAEVMVQELNQQTSIREFEFISPGGGIRGSLQATLLMIPLTLLISLPIGVSAAIYFQEYAKKNQFTRLLRSFIELLTGIPSIIYGLMGLAIFVPLTAALTPATGGNILAGAMTLSVILLPVVIRTTEETLKVIPKDFRSGSLALGATQTQTVFKVVLPNAMPGILTSTLLAIGRIVGESAALVFAVGTVIVDNVSVFSRGTTLAVQIYSLMAFEPANPQLASSIALLIMIVVLILNLLLKLITSRLQLFKGAR